MIPAIIAAVVFLVIAILVFKSLSVKSKQADVQRTKAKTGQIAASAKAADTVGTGNWFQRRAKRKAFAKGVRQ